MFNPFIVVRYIKMALELGWLMFRFSSVKLFRLVPSYVVSAVLYVPLKFRFFSVMFEQVPLSIMVFVVLLVML